MLANSNSSLSRYEMVVIAEYKLYEMRWFASAVLIRWGFPTIAMICTLRVGEEKAY